MVINLVKRWINHRESRQWSVDLEFWVYFRTLFIARRATLLLCLAEMNNFRHGLQFLTWHQCTYNKIRIPRTVLVWNGRGKWPRYFYHTKWDRKKAWDVWLSDVDFRVEPLPAMFDLDVGNLSELWTFSVSNGKDIAICFWIRVKQMLMKWNRVKSK